MNIGESVRTTHAGLSELLTRVRGEYSEMPGLRLTLAQACRFWQLDEATCETILRILVQQQFLRTAGHDYLTNQSSS